MRRLGLLALVALVPACRAEDSASGISSSVVSASATAPSASATAARPPAAIFVAEPWKSVFNQIPAVSPPDSVFQTWRVFVKQVQPRQKPNARWIPLPPRDAVELTMQPETSFRCVVQPLEVHGVGADEDQKFGHWALLRRVVCSSDHWATWTEGQLLVLVFPDGTVKPTVDHLEMFLRERIDATQTRETVLLLRSDMEPSGKATTGPPRIVASSEPEPK